MYAGNRTVDDQQANLIMLETNIDDMNPEILGGLLDELLALGARDAWLENIQMKKNRPGILLKVLSKSADQAKLTRFILLNTSTFGVRHYPVGRTCLERRFEEVDTPFGVVKVKLGYLDGKLIKASPEYEDMRQLARVRGLSVYVVEQAARAVIWQVYGEIGK